MSTVITGLPIHFWFDGRWHVIRSAGLDAKDEPYVAIEPENQTLEARLKAKLVASRQLSGTYTIDNIRVNKRQCFLEDYGAFQMWAQRQSEAGPDSPRSKGIDLLTVAIGSPLECSNSDLATFESLVRKGDEVDPVGLQQRIRAAAHVALISTDAGQVIGIAALKRRAAEYRQKIFTRAGTGLAPTEGELELGWIFIEEEYRRKGLSRMLVEALLNAAGNLDVYATTREENIAMRRTLASFRFDPTGEPYASKNGDYALILYSRRRATGLQK